jgi:succinate dehydrogenase / fumarate reductase cytochrome b subunit
MHWTYIRAALTLAHMVTLGERPRRGPAGTTTGNARVVAGPAGGPKAAPPAGRRRPRVTSMQLKLVMAVSGVLMFLFLVAHMIGNLKIFLGAQTLDAYSAWLREVGEPALPAQTILWAIRIVLLLAVVGHIVSAAILTRRAHRARPVKYAHRKPVKGSYAARTMRWGGVIVALFLVYHILDLTTGALNPNGQPGHVYDNVVTDFAPDRWYVTVWYVLAVLAIGFHIRHGLWSGLQTIGRSSAVTQNTLKAVALVIAVVMTAGFLVVPLSVSFGLVS